LPLPAALQETALLTGQYLEIAIDEVQRMQRAAACRGLAGSSGWLRYVSAAAIGALYVRSLDRAERVYGAMTARGYRGTFPITTEPADAHRGWLWATAGAIALLSGASYWV
jgi:cobalt/nickel transport system permease protein